MAGELTADQMWRTINEQKYNEKLYGGKSQGLMKVDDNSVFTTNPMIAPTYTPPPAYVPPSPYTAPEWNKNEIQNIEQRKAAPGLRAARSALQRVTAGIAGYGSSPKRMSLREALAGHGEAISKVMGSAETAAESEYARQYGVTADQAKTRYAGDVNTAGINYQTGVHNADMTFQGLLASFNAANMMARQSMVSGGGGSMGGGGGSKGGGNVKGVSWAPSTPSPDPWAKGGQFYHEKDPGVNPDYAPYRFSLDNE